MVVPLSVKIKRVTETAKEAKAKSNIFSLSFIVSVVTLIVIYDIHKRDIRH
jgi:hypothetical protein